MLRSRALAAYTALQQARSYALSADASNSSHTNKNTAHLVKAPVERLLQRALLGLERVPRLALGPLQVLPELCHVREVHLVVAREAAHLVLDPACTAWTSEDAGCLDECVRCAANALNLRRSVCGPDLKLQ